MRQCYTLKTKIGILKRNTHFTKKKEASEINKDDGNNEKLKRRKSD